VDGQPRNEDDYLRRVETEAQAEGNPLFHLGSNFRRELARRIFLAREVLEIENEDISTKERDGEANMHNRRYVDGSF
jgi:hypothetical protein